MARLKATNTLIDDIFTGKATYLIKTRTTRKRKLRANKMAISKDKIIFSFNDKDLLKLELPNSTNFSNGDIVTILLPEAVFTISLLE